MSWISVISDWAYHALVAIGLAVSGLVGAVTRNTKRSKQNARQLQGDPKDPNTDGVLQIAAETREDLNEFYNEFEDFTQETKQDHQRVIRKLEEMNGEHG